MFKPKIAPIKGVYDENGLPVEDAFEMVGEPIAVRYLCEGGIRSLFGKTLPPLTPTKIKLEARFLSPQPNNE